MHKEGWTPPEAPVLTGVYEPNDALVTMDRLKVGLGPESVAINQAGTIYCGLEDGSIVRWAEGVGEAEALLNIGGRPLGMAFDADGNLIVCDLYGRLLAISETGNIEEMVTQVGDRPLGLVNDLDIAADGTVYFSESSTKITNTMLDLLEHRPRGRLLAYHPSTGRTEVLLDKLYYANGVALSFDESFILVVETTRYRVRRLWLSGPAKVSMKCCLAICRVSRMGSRAIRWECFGWHLSTRETHSSIGCSIIHRSGRSLPASR